MVYDYLTVICIYFTKFDIIKFNILNIKMLNSIKSNVNEAGIDEAGRGCLMGPVCTAAVILPDNFSTELYLEIRDSKKLSRKKRETLRKYIEDVAISWAVDFAYPSEIDKYNIPTVIDPSALSIKLYLNPSII
jgi:ribonuclease HIII